MLANILPCLELFPFDKDPEELLFKYSVLLALNVSKLLFKLENYVSLLDILSLKSIYLMRTLH